MEALEPYLHLGEVEAVVPEDILELEEAAGSGMSEVLLDLVEAEVEELHITMLIQTITKEKVEVVEELEFWVRGQVELVHQLHHLEEMLAGEVPAEHQAVRAMLHSAAVAELMAAEVEDLMIFPEILVIRLAVVPFESFGVQEDLSLQLTQEMYDYQTK
jgi:hypothetical protein